MAVYTQLNKEIINQILLDYEIGTLKKVELLKGGSANSNYFVDTDLDQYVLTVCDAKSFDAARMLVNLLDHLNEFQFHTSRIVKNKKGEGLSLFNGKPVMLKMFLPGKIIENLDDDHLIKTGALLGQLHTIPVPEFLPTYFYYGENVFQTLEESIKDHPFIEWLEPKLNYLKEHLHPELPKCLIHGDLFYNNVIINEDHPVIMDFEEACLYYRIFDVGMAIVGLCCGRGEIQLSKMSSLIKGYQQLIQLNKMEKESLKAFIIYAAIATAFWRFKQFNFLEPDEARKDSYLEMKNIADQIFQVNQKAITHLFL